MPLITVPDPVPFIAVTKAVFAHRARAERQELEWALQTQRALPPPRSRPAACSASSPRIARRPAGPASSSICSDECWPSPTPGVSACSRGWPGRSSRYAAGLAAAAADISDGRRRELHALGARRLRAWLLIDGPAELPGPSVSGDLVSLLSLDSSAATD